MPAESLTKTRQLVTSSSNQVRLERAADYITSLGAGTEIVLVAPTRGAADDFARTCAIRAEALSGVHRTTLTGLVANLATEGLARRGLAPVTRLGTEALAARSIHSCRGGLVYFGPVADAPGFPGALASTLSELRMQQLSRHRLASTGAPGRDLALLLDYYERELVEHALADYALMCAEATQAVGQRKHRLLGLPLVMLDVVPDWRAEEIFVKDLLRRAPAVFATALRQDEEGVALLESLFGVKSHCLDQDSISDSLHRLRQWMFSTVDAELKELDSTVEIFSAPGEGLECVEIARRILRAARAEDQDTAKRGIPFDRMAILLRNPETYLPFVEEALRRAGIEGYFTRGTVRPDPSGRAFLALLACAEEGLSASRFAEYLSLGQVPRPTESGAPPQREPEELFVPPEDELQLSFKFPESDSRSVLQVRDSREAPGTAVDSSAFQSLIGSDNAPDDAENQFQDNEPAVIAGALQAPFNWEKLLVDAAVIGGKDRWSRRLRGLENEFRVKLEEAEGEEGNESQRDYLVKQLEHLRNLENFALPLVAFLGDLPVSAPWGQWLAAFTRLAGMALRRPESVLSVLAELQPMEQVGPVTLAEVRQSLTERLGSLRREPPARRYGKLFVSTIDEAGGRSFDFVFLPGLAEGLFPRRASEDPLLLDEYRTALSPSLLTREKRAARERLALRRALAAAGSRICISYPRMDLAQARSRVPSVFALDVLRAAEGVLPPLNQLESRAMEGSQAKLGWPAPENPSDALDDAEHDLAVLEPLLRSPADEVKGRAVYLLEASPILARSLRTRWQRWNWKWSVVDGIYNPAPAALNVLAKHRMSVRSYSPSALQNYSICPYRFLLQAIHRLREREEAAAIERLDPLTRGGLFHEVQFQFFRAAQREKVLPVSDRNQARAMDLADEVYDAIVKKWEEDLAPAIPQVWHSEIEDLRTDLRGWVQMLAKIQAEWVPIHFEYAFGLPPGPARDTERDPESQSSAIPILDGMKLRGSIDLVERGVNSDCLRVTDHKTGRPLWPEPRCVGKGEVLQPLLYALAAENAFGRPVKSGVLFYCTQRGNYKSVEIALNSEGRKWIAQVLRTIDGAIERGLLPAAPRKDACRICDYEMVCGPLEELRVSEKKARLDLLDALRCLP